MAIESGVIMFLLSEEIARRTERVRCTIQSQRSDQLKNKKTYLKPDCIYNTRKIQYQCNRGLVEFTTQDAHRSFK